MTLSIKTLLLATCIIFVAAFGYKLYSDINKDIQGAKTFLEPLYNKK